MDNFISEGSTGALAYVVNGKKVSYPEYLTMIREFGKDIGEVERTPQWEAVREKFGNIVVHVSNKTNLGQAKAADGLRTLKKDFPEFYLFTQSSYVVYRLTYHDIVITLVGENGLEGYSVTALDSLLSISRLGIANTEFKQPDYSPSYEMKMYDKATITTAMYISKMSAVDPTLDGDIYDELVETLRGNFFGASGLAGQTGRLRATLNIARLRNTVGSLLELGFKIRVFEEAKDDYFAYAPPAVIYVEPDETLVFQRRDRKSIAEKLWRSYETLMIPVFGSMTTTGSRTSYLPHYYLFFTPQLALLDQLYSSIEGPKVLESLIVMGELNSFLGPLYALPSAEYRLEKHPLETKLVEYTAGSEEYYETLHQITSYYTAALEPFYVSLMTFKSSSTAGLLIEGKHRDVKFQEIGAAIDVMKNFHTVWEHLSLEDRLTYLNGLALSKCVPKNEVYPVEKKGIKERNIYATNTFFGLGCQMFNRAFWQAFKMHHGEWMDDSTNLIRVMYPASMVSSVMNRMAIRDAQQPLIHFTHGTGTDHYRSLWHADVYSDNAYLTRTWASVEAFKEYYAQAKEFSSEEEAYFDQLANFESDYKQAGRQFTFVEKVSLDGSSMEASSGPLDAVLGAVYCINAMFPGSVSTDKITELILTVLKIQEHEEPNPKERPPAQGISQGWIAYLINFFITSTDTPALLGKTQFMTGCLASGTAITFLMNTFRMTAHATRMIQYVTMADMFLAPFHPAAYPPMMCIQHQYHDSLREHRDFISKVYLDAVNDPSSPLPTQIDVVDVLRSGKVAPLNASLKRTNSSQPEIEKMLFTNIPRPFFLNEEHYAIFEAASIMRGVKLTRECYSPPWSQPSDSRLVRPLITGIKRLDLLGFDAHVSIVNGVPFSFPVLARDRLNKMLLWTKAGMRIKGDHSTLNEVLLRCARLMKYRTAYVLGAWADKEYSTLVRQLIQNEVMTIDVLALGEDFDSQFQKLQMQAAESEGELTEGLMEQLSFDSISALISQPVPSIAAIAKIFFTKSDFNLFMTLMADSAMSADGFYSDVEADAAPTMSELLFGESDLKYKQVPLDDVLSISKKRMGLIGAAQAPKVLFGALGLFKLSTASELEQTFAQAIKPEELKEALPEVEKAFYLLLEKKAHELVTPLNMYEKLSEVEFQVARLPRKLVYHLMRMSVASMSKQKLSAVRYYFANLPAQVSKQLPMYAANIPYVFLDPINKNIIGRNVATINKPEEMFANKYIIRESKIGSNTKKGGKLLRGIKKKFERDWSEQELLNWMEERADAQEYKEAEAEKFHSDQAQAAFEKAVKRGGKFGQYEED